MNKKKTDPPKFIPLDERKVAVEGMNVSLQCNVTGRDQSPVKWFRESNETMPDGGRWTIVQISNQTNILQRVCFFFFRSRTM